MTKEQVHKGDAALHPNKYDLFASRYRQVDADAVYHEKPLVTLELNILTKTEKPIAK